jgi:hypothetical protein
LKKQLKTEDKDLGLGKIMISVSTNGLSKILTISDKVEEDEDLLKAIKQSKKFSYLNYNLFEKEDPDAEDESIMTKLMEI